MPAPWRASASLVTASLVAALLTGCSAGMARTHQGEALHYIDYAGAPVERFNTFHLDGWNAVARDQLVVWTGVNEAYLLTVWDSCRDLQFAERVGVSSTANVVSRLDYVRIGHDRCPISEIRPIDLKRMKADRAAAKAASASG